VLIGVIAGADAVVDRVAGWVTSHSKTLRPRRTFNLAAAAMVTGASCRLAQAHI